MSKRSNLRDVVRSCKAAFDPEVRCPSCLSTYFNCKTRSLFTLAMTTSVSWAGSSILETILPLQLMVLSPRCLLWSICCPYSIKRTPYGVCDGGDDKGTRELWEGLIVVEEINAILCHLTIKVCQLWTSQFQVPFAVIRRYGGTMGKGLSTWLRTVRWRRQEVRNTQNAIGIVGIALGMTASEDEKQGMGAIEPVSE